MDEWEILENSEEKLMRGSVEQAHEFESSSEALHKENSGSVRTPTISREKLTKASPRGCAMA